MTLKNVNFHECEFHTLNAKAMWYEDKGKTYANDYYYQKIKEHAALHDLKAQNTGFDQSARGSHLEHYPFIVDWQMPETEIRTQYESFPVY